VSLLEILVVHVAEGARRRVRVPHVERRALGLRPLLAELLRAGRDLHLRAARERRHPAVEEPAVGLRHPEPARLDGVDGGVGEQRQRERDESGRDRSKATVAPEHVRQPRRYEEQAGGAQHRRARQQQTAGAHGRRARPPVTHEDGAGDDEEREERLREHVLEQLSSVVDEMA